MFRLDVISNNLANYATAGFKEDKPYFRDIMQFFSDNRFASQRRNASLSRSINSATNFSPGVIRQTGNELDVAIQGDGFFVAQKDGQEIFTRCGTFRLDEEGRLTTPDGSLVMGEGGEIVVGPGALEVDSEGNIMVNGETIDKLKIIEFDDHKKLQKRSGNFFENKGAANPNDEPEFKIVHKALEMSNVNPVRQLAELVDAGRSFEAYQKIIKIIDDINQSSTSTLGRV